ncbi:hypothetical protein N9Q05_00950 [bacterium]|nr:hypothetical protein [bacterium]
MSITKQVPLDSSDIAQDGSTTSIPTDPFHYEAPDIAALDADQVMHGGCSPAPTCGNGGNGTATLSAAVAGGGIAL